MSGAESVFALTHRSIAAAALIWLPDPSTPSSPRVYHRPCATSAVPSCAVHRFEWASGAMGAAELSRLRQLFELLPETGVRGSGLRGRRKRLETVSAAPSDVFRILDPRVRRAEPIDVTLVVHAG